MSAIMEGLLSRSRRFRRSKFGKFNASFSNRFWENSGKFLRIMVFCNKNNVFVFFVVLPIIIFFVAVDDEEAMCLYLQELQTLSEHRIKKNQLKNLKLFYVTNKNRNPLLSERHRVRREFES